LAGSEARQLMMGLELQLWHEGRSPLTILLLGSSLASVNRRAINDGKTAREHLSKCKPDLQQKRHLGKYRSNKLKGQSFLWFR